VCAKDKNIAGVKGKEADVGAVSGVTSPESLVVIKAQLSASNSVTLSNFVLICDMNYPI
jgi:hypothetical protein